MTGPSSPHLNFDLPTPLPVSAFVALKAGPLRLLTGIVGLLVGQDLHHFLLPEGLGAGHWL